MATSDMSLGGGAGFGANYTPIRFAPLFSLSGPVRTTPEPPATEEQIPQTALPFRYDMNAGGQGGYDGPQREYGADFQSIGNRSRDEIMQDMKNIGMFFASPLSGLAGAMAQNAGIPNPFSSFLSSLQNFFGKMYGPEQVQLYERRAPLETATPISVQAIQVAEALGITPAQAAASIAAGGLGGLTSSQAAAILEGGSYSEMTGESPGVGGGSATGVTEGFGAPGSVADVSGGQAPY